MKYRDVERFLIAAGWRVLRTKGSHEVWGAPNAVEKLTIPRHSEVTPGVVRQIIKALPDAPENWR